MPVWDETLSFNLPYTNAAACYQLLEKYPEIQKAFFETIVPLAVGSGDIAARVQQIEVARQQALNDYLASGRSLREVDTALNCAMSDLYMALFMTAAERIQHSPLPLVEKMDGIQTLRQAAKQGIAWNPTKQMEIDMLLDGTGEEIQLED